MTFPDSHQTLGPGKLPAAILARLLGSLGQSDECVLVGPGVGRDAAAIAFGDRVLVVKTDPITFATEGAAAYLVDVNANDLACMGAQARWLLVTSMFPEGTTVGDVGRLFSELTAVCRARGVSLIGGHTEVTPGIDRALLVGTLLGDATHEGLLRPGGARVGDDLYVARGIAIEGTALLARELRAVLVPLVGEASVDAAAALFDAPGIAVAADAAILRDVPGVRALHDPTEGGLGTGVRELAAAAGCGVLLERDAVPVLRETAVVAGALGLDPLGMLASGALLVAAAPEARDRLREVASGHGIPLTRIGSVVPAEAGLLLRSGGIDGPLPEWTTDEVGRALLAHAVASSRTSPLESCT